MDKLKSLLQRFTGLWVLSQLLSLPVSGQAKLVLDGAKINIHGGASLVITNPANDAIIRNSGYIISEGEGNVLKWHIGPAEGAYLIPWGVGNDTYLPLSFRKAGGEGAGHFTFSTYGTGWNNSSSLPAAIPSLESDGSDMSAYVVDRFWQIDAQGYAVNPSVSDITFTYLAEEATAEGNTILEDNLQVYNWNETQSTWDESLLGGIADPANNTVTLSSVEVEQVNGWWFLADNASTLPVELLYFSARVSGRHVLLEWATASEQQSSFFTVERSKDSKVYEAVKTVKGAINSNVRTNYEVTDENPAEGTVYYRLKQVDLDGAVHYSNIQAVEVASGKQEDKLVVYPNPVTSGYLFVETDRVNAEHIQVELFDMLGRKIPLKAVPGNHNVLEIAIDPSLKTGPYILQVQDNLRLFRQKVIIR